MKKIKEVLLFLLPILLTAAAGYAIAILRPDIVQKMAIFTFVVAWVVFIIIILAILENIIPQKWKDSFADLQNKGWQQIKDMSECFLALLALVVSRVRGAEEDEGDAKDYPLPPDYIPKPHTPNRTDVGD